MVKNLLRTSLAVVLLLVLSGCQQAVEEVAANSGPPPVEPSVAAPNSGATPQVVDSAAVLREAMARYVAPFPERSDLFVAPKGGAKSSAGPETEGDVQLRGLVDVGQLQAILDIEGSIALIAVGGEKLGVKVVSIDHHQVVLERGVTRWTASLD